MLLIEVKNKKIMQIKNVHHSFLMKDAKYSEELWRN